MYVLRWSCTDFDNILMTVTCFEKSEVSQDTGVGQEMQAQGVCLLLPSPRAMAEKNTWVYEQVPGNLERISCLIGHSVAKTSYPSLWLVSLPLSLLPHSCLSSFLSFSLLPSLSPAFHPLFLLFCHLLAEGLQLWKVEHDQIIASHQAQVNFSIVIQSGLLYTQWQDHQTYHCVCLWHSLVYVDQCQKATLSTWPLFPSSSFGHFNINCCPKVSAT